MASSKEYSLASSYVERLPADAKKRYHEKIVDVDGLDPYQIPNSSLSVDKKQLPDINHARIVQYFVLGKSAYTCEDFAAYKSLGAYRTFVCGWVREVRSYKPDGCQNTVVSAKKQLQQTLCDVTSYGSMVIAGYSFLSIVIMPCLLASKSFRAVQASLNACAVLFSTACACFLLLCFLSWCNALTQDDPSASCYQMVLTISPQGAKLSDAKDFFWTTIVQISVFSVLMMVSMLMLLAYALRTESPTYRTLGEIRVTSRPRLTPESQGLRGESNSETTPLIQSRPFLATSA